MIARGYLYMSLVPEQMYAPGLIIMITAVAFNALGNPCGRLWIPRRGGTAD